MGVRHETYWQGYRSGQVLAADPARDYEGELKLNVALVESRTNIRRAFHLGELRGYRDARDELPRHVTGPPVSVEGWKRERQAELERMTQEAMRASNAGAWEER